MPENEKQQADTPSAIDAKLLDRAEAAVEASYATGKAERAAITQSAQLDAAEAVALAGIAMEADEAMDEAMRIAFIAEHNSDRPLAKEANRRYAEARRQSYRKHREATKAAKKAYDAIKFSAPNKLGFMRFVQFVYAVNIASTIILLLLTSRDAVLYDFANIFDWVLIVFQGVAFWFFVNRYRITRPFVIAICAASILVPVAYGILMGSPKAYASIPSIAFNVFLICYFIFSRRVRAAMVNDIVLHDGVLDREDYMAKRWSWPFVRNLIIYFVVFSVLGHFMEAGFCELIALGLVQGDYDPTYTILWRDWLYPYSLEGGAVVLIALLLYPLKEWLCERMGNPVAPYIVSFFANAFACTMIELVMGLLINADLQFWDYTDMPFNFLGQICLQNALGFGVASSIITWFVYPLLERGISRVPTAVMNIVFIVVVLYGAIVYSLYLIDPPENLRAGIAYDAPLGDASYS